MKLYFNLCLISLFFVVIFFILSIFSLPETAALKKDATQSPFFFDISRQKEISDNEAITQLRNKRIILIGEHHSNIAHHWAQLRVIQLLHDAGAPIAIGLEMFRNGSQEVLDRWVHHEINETEFIPIYYDNWNFPWSAYRMIFDYARQKNIPMIGLNVPREITRQVAYHGFKSLSPEQKGKLPEIACNVDRDYKKYIRSAFGAHVHGHLNFSNFCEAQLVWDKVMTINTVEYLEKNPEKIVVILTGIGHAMKKAVPTQIRLRTDLSFAVIVLQVLGSTELHRINANEADFIMITDPID